MWWKLRLHVEYEMSSEYLNIMVQWKEEREVIEFI